MKLLQSVLTVSDREWRRDLRLYVWSVLSGRNWCETWWGLWSMFEKRLSSMSATSWDGVGSSAVYKPSRIARRTDASRRCLSVALVKPHHAGDATVWRGRRTCRRASVSRHSCRDGATVSGRAANVRTCQWRHGCARRQRDDSSWWRQASWWRSRGEEADFSVLKYTLLSESLRSTEHKKLCHNIIQR